jgi:hypothetical protein
MFTAPGVVERMVRTHCSPQRYRELVEPTLTTIESRARILLEPVTLLGITSHVHVLGVRTNNLDKNTLIEAEAEDRLREHCLEVIANAAAMQIDDLERLLREIEDQVPDTSLFINGHDFASAVATIARAKCGGRISGRGLESALIGSFQWVHLESTRVYRELTAYAELVGRTIWAVAA